MRKIKKWSMIMLMFVALPLIVSCGDDDNATDLTTEEIVNMLTGKWDIKGTVRVDYVYSDIVLEGDYTGTKDYDLKWEGDYTGTIEFTENKDCYIHNSSKIYLRDKQGNIYRENGISLTSELSYFLEEKYSILRKNGKTYIAFGKQSFQIVSLNKNSFKLLEDEDIDYGYGETVHYYITIISK